MRVCVQTISQGECVFMCVHQQVLQLSEEEQEEPMTQQRGRVGNPGVHWILTGTKLAPPLGELVRRLQHLHQEGVNGRITNQFKEEQVLQALQTDGAQCREPEEELCKPA